MAATGFTFDLSGTCFRALLSSLRRLGIICGLLTVEASAPLGDNQEALDAARLRCRSWFGVVRMRMVRCGQVSCSGLERMKACDRPREKEKQAEGFRINMW